MTSSRDLIDWDGLKPRILQDLANGKTQEQIRKGLAGESDDAFRVSISKSQLETQLKHWKYRHGLHEQEWRVAIHRINKRRKAGKPSSQVLVNGFIFDKKKVAKAISRYDTPTLTCRMRKPSTKSPENNVVLTEAPASPQIPPELSHHLIEVRTPPSNHQSLPAQHSQGTMAQMRHDNLSLCTSSTRRIWPRTAQWSKLELSIGQFVDRFVLPRYERDEWNQGSFHVLRPDSFVSRTDRGEGMSAPCLNPESFLQDEACPNDGVRKSLAGSHMKTAVVQPLLSLLYGLSNKSLDGISHKALASILESPEFDGVLTHLKGVLIVMDSKMIQSIAEGLLKESIDTRNHAMLDLALDLGANTTQRIKYSNLDRFLPGKHIFYTPLVALCDERTRISKGRRLGESKSGPEKLILSLLRRDPNIPDSTLLWLIRAGCHAIAEEVIRNQPERVVNFAIAASELEGASWLRFDTYDPVNPLLVACSDSRQSAEKLSLIRCLLERNAEADLGAMIAAAGACDVEVISLLHSHGAPVNGFIPHLGSPLASACKASLYSPELHYADLTAIQLLLSLGASPNNFEDRALDDWESSPLHILALAKEQPVVVKSLNLLIEHGARINHRARLYQLRNLRCQVLGVRPEGYQLFAETALEHAIAFSRFNSATQLLSAGCGLTGREILFVENNAHRQALEKKTAQERFGKFIDTLLTKAPTQAAALHWCGLSVLQLAIQNEDEEMVLALFRAGLRPRSLDFLYMLCNRKDERAKVSELSCGIQMKLMRAARTSEHPFTDISTLRLTLAIACPEAVRYVLKCCPFTYDSEGLCFMIARVLSNDKIRYHDVALVDDLEEDQQVNAMTIEDLRTFISRRTTSNRHEDWESTAVTIVARAGRSDILRMLTGSIGHDFQNSGMVPLFLIKEFLIGEPDTYGPFESYEPLAFGMDFEEWNWDRLGVWLKYCRMDDPAMRCSPLTAAAAVVPTEAAEEMVDLLLALKYQPDGWTVLVASCQGRVSILERLKRLECWPYILSHEDRPEWCPTALQAAVYSKHHDIVELLCDAEPRIVSRDLPPRQPFCFAPLDESGAPYSHTILPRTALQHAVHLGDMELVTFLVDAGADVNAPAAMNSGATALQIASIQGSVPMVEYLISHGADPHAAGAAKHGRTSLQGAAEHGRKDIVELLLAQGATTANWHREDLVEAAFHAEQNTHHVVASILRERLLPQWSLEDEEKLEMLREDWESSSEHSAFHELKANIEAWEETLEDWPESLQAYRGNSDLGVGGGELQIRQPAAPQGYDFWFPQGMEWDVEDHGGFDVHWNSEVDAYGGDIASELTFQDDATFWAEGELTLEAHDADGMLPGDSSFGSFI